MKPSRFRLIKDMSSTPGYVLQCFTYIVEHFGMRYRSHEHEYRRIFFVLVADLNLCHCFIGFMVSQYYEVFVALEA